MNRHIYKAKCKDNNQWIYGYYIVTNEINSCYKGHLDDVKHYLFNIEFGLLSDLSFVEIDHNTLCACTGVLDKNNRILFEHDIVKMRSYNGGYHETEVYFKDGKYAVDGSNYSFKDICSKSVEFVRNKFD